MNITSYNILDHKVIIRLKDRVCENSEELFTSELFYEVLKKCLNKLLNNNSHLLKIFPDQEINEDNIKILIQILIYLEKVSFEVVPNIVKGSAQFLKDPDTLNDFVEYLYNYWRSFDRFIVCDSEGDVLDKRPYRTFNDTVESLMHLIRLTYRNLQENITGQHPRIYRQLRAGAQVAAIALPKDIPFPGELYKKLSSIPVIRQILLYPPLILNPPMNKRTGKFEKINKNPLEEIDLQEDQFLCYPAKVGEFIILLYFHEKFYELGFSLCNLFELANDEDLKRKPDAVYVFGTDNTLEKLGKYRTVFYDDEENNIFAAACPNLDEYGYFGYLKKMTLTLHNAKIMKTDRWPFHGALVKITLSDKERTVLFIGDTGAGKSESLEALRTIGSNIIKEITIIADDMGSLVINNKNEIIGYGTEIGAFLRLDDLQPGYAYGQMDRAIIMNPTQINARIILPVTTFKTVMEGIKIDYILYANNYELVDDDHPIIEQFKTPDQALSVFEAGAVMSKGTTTSTGIVHSYFANVFGPPQYKEIHDVIAKKYFNAFFKAGVYVGQIRTRLGISGFERTGPEEAAKELLNIL